MPYPRLLMKAILPAFMVITLAACAAISGQETAGEYVDDATITTKVKAAFVDDPQVKAMQVNVETMQGIVQLSGFVDSQAAEQRAVELARQVRGVKSVKDNIVVRGNADSSGGATYQGRHPSY